MKRSNIQVILKPAFALAAGLARLNNEEDSLVVTPEQAREYQGSSFEEGTEGCTDLHILYVGGMACINFKDEQGNRKNYDYPVDTIARIRHS